MTLSQKGFATFFKLFFSKYVWDQTTSLLYFIVFLLPVAMVIRMKERPWNSQSLNRGGEIKEIACPIKNWVNTEINVIWSYITNFKFYRLFHQIFSFVKKIKKCLWYKIFHLLQLFRNVWKIHEWKHIGSTDSVKHLHIILWNRTD